MVTTWPDAPISDVAAIMETRKIGCVVVLNEGKVVGIVTEADFVKLARLYCSNASKRAQGNEPSLRSPPSRGWVAGGSVAAPKRS